jgi:hypothetical protein
MIGLIFWGLLLYMWFADPPGAELELFILGMVGFGLLLSVSVLLAMIQMLRRHWYGFALTGCLIGIVAGIPFFTPFGVWGLLVLLRPEVKAAFRD